MSVRGTVKAVVKPVVGDRGWAALRRMKKRMGGGAGQIPRQRSRPAEPDPTTFADDLPRLAAHFKTDKWGTHRYARHYQRHFEHLRDQPINLLEIGIGGYSKTGQGGASLRMWKHFFPKAQIFGMDIEDKSFVDEDRITTFIGDQSDPSTLRAIAKKIGRIDVIIDDGSHFSPHIILTFDTLFPLLAPDGIYVVEDTQTSYWPEWQGRAERDATDTSMAMLKSLTDGLNYEEFVDDDYQPTYTDLHVVATHFYHNLVIIEKGANAEGTNKKRVLRKRYAEPASS
jgi:hypothetical protein